MNSASLNKLSTPASASFAHMSSELLTALPRNFRTAITGPHRTGKTTLARAYAEVVGVPYIDASVTQVLAEGGIDSSANYSTNIGQRLKAQQYLLEYLDEAWDNVHGGLITDRSPLCFAMYSLCDVTGATDMTQEQCTTLTKYLNDCKALTLKHFNTVVLLPMNPQIELVPAPGKGRANPAYIHHLYTVVDQLFRTLDRRVDAAPEDFSETSLISWELLNSATASSSTVDVVEGLLKKQGAWGPLAERLLDVFADDAGSPTVRAVLPHKKVTLESRLQWLINLNLSKLLNWLTEGLDHCADSPLICQRLAEATTLG